MRGDASNSCRHADYCEKPTAPMAAGEISVNKEEVRCHVLDALFDVTDVFAQEDESGNYIVINRIMEAIDPYLATREPVATGEMLDVTCDHSECPHWGLIKFPAMEPVSLEKCWKNYQEPSHLSFQEDVFKDAIKKELDAAGVRYHD